MLNEIGRLCVKTAGRDSNKICVVVDVVDNSTVLIDGQTRRRKCNLRHLEPLQKVIDIKKGASSSEVKAAFLKIGMETRETKPKNAEPRQKIIKVNKQGTVEPKEKKEKAPKKEKPAKKVAEKKAKKVSEKKEE